MNKEKRLVTSFFAANLADISSTLVGLNINIGAEEKFPFRHFIDRGDVNTAIVTKMAITAVVIGLYALTKESNNRFAFSFETAIKAVNIIYWGVVVWNSAQIAAEIIIRSH